MPWDPCSAWTKTPLFSMYPLCFVHDDSQTEKFLLYNPQSRLSERITSPPPLPRVIPLAPLHPHSGPPQSGHPAAFTSTSKAALGNFTFQGFVPPLSFEGGKNGNVPPPAGPSQQVVNPKMGPQLGTWRANFAVGARQVPSWRANFDLASKKLTSTQKTHILQHINKATQP